MQRVEHGCEEPHPAQRVDVTAVCDREQRHARGQRRDRTRDEPVRDDRVPPPRPACDGECHARREQRRRGDREHRMSLEPVRCTAVVEQRPRDPGHGVRRRAAHTRGDHLDVVAERSQRVDMCGDEAAGRITGRAWVRRRDDAELHSADRGVALARLRACAASREPHDRSSTHGIGCSAVPKLIPLFQCSP